MSVGKQAAGVAAAEMIEPGMVLGLGTGSTVQFFLTSLAERALDVAGVPTSKATADACRALGIRLLDLAEVDRIDLTVDGADELTSDLALTKGGGGALLREKVVAAASDRMVVIATPEKLVERLGATFPLPVEIIPFAESRVRAALAMQGAQEVHLRAGGEPTDNGLPILDARFPSGIEDPDVTAAALSLTPGVAEHGLFVDLATEALLGADSGEVQRLTAPTATLDTSD